MISQRLPFRYYPDFASYFRLLKQLLVICLLTFVVSALARGSGLLLLDVSWQDVDLADFFNLFFYGLRFDIAAALRLLLLFILLSSASLVFPTKLQHWIHSLVLLVGLVLLIVLPIFDIGNLAYMSFFKEPFDEFVIEALFFDWAVIGAGITGAGTAALFLLLGLVVIAVYGYYTVKLVRQVAPPKRLYHFIVSWLLVLLCFLMVVVLARGTLTSFPLEQRNSAVTSNHQMNKLVLNGAFSFYNAWDVFTNSVQLEPATEEEGRQLFEDYYGVQASAGPVFDQFFHVTPANSQLENAPPHVVLGIVESLSTSLLDESYTESTQLAGRLMAHFAADIWFPRFTPAHNFTQASIANILTNLNYPVISQSRHKSYSLDTAVAKIYQQKGYKTVYIYSGYESVRDGANYYLRQGFDEFVGANRLLQDYPHLPLNVWGGEDWYAFDYAKRLLAESEQPLFIVMHTLTNHPPYAAPDLPWLENKMPVTERLRKVNGSLPEEAIHTYHYTTEVLSDFLDYVKQGELAQRTVVALTGDHGQRGALSTSATDLFTKAVPFYLYMPPSLQPQQAVDTNVLGSHRDIMPTLINLTLSEAKYPNLGNNLLQPRTAEKEFAILHGATLTNEGYVYPGQAESVRAYESDNSFIYADKQALNNKQAYHYAEAYKAAMDWLKRYQLQNKDLIVK
jgi:phosphoglycerol transferase MdoB-like AlkP superfamily enzyme